MQQFYQVPDLKNRDIRRLARRSLTGKWGMAMLPMLIITLALILPALIQYWDLMASGILDSSAQNAEAIFEEMNKRQTGPFFTLMSIFSFLFTGVFSLASAALSVRILRNESFNVKTAFVGFRQFLQAFLVDILISLFSFFWGLVTILPGTMIFIFCMQSQALLLFGVLVFILAVVVYIILVLRYSMAFFIAQDNRFLPSLHAVRYSVTLMKGRIKKYFLLQLSFIGWILLASIPMSFGFIFLSLSSETESGLLKLIGICLILIGLVTVAMVQLYVNTADAVFYSAVSGNFSLSDPSPEEADDPVVEPVPSVMIQKATVEAVENREAASPEPVGQDAETSPSVTILEESAEAVENRETVEPESIEQKVETGSSGPDSEVTAEAVENREAASPEPIGQEAEISPSGPDPDGKTDQDPAGKRGESHRETRVSPDKDAGLIYTFEETPDDVKKNEHAVEDGLLIFVEDPAGPEADLEEGNENDFSDDFLDELMKLDADENPDNSGDWHFSEDAYPDERPGREE
ncbi:MAG: DUF975 family protein [Firmicutes bacterium]|nr:DUF975 family protein [Bacillota bacterium]